MQPTVSIGVPVYRRLAYLPNALRVAEEQDYPRIELIVSDNGQNGEQIDDLVHRHYSRPCRIRRNTETAHISAHYNQLIHFASGEYFVLLADDDEISPNFVSELVRKLESNRRAHVAIGRQEILDENGVVLRASVGILPPAMDGFEFIRAAWKDYRYRYECFATTLARTDTLRRSGGYPPFHRGTHNDDAVLIKLALQGPVVFSNECAFRWRVYPTSHGWSLPIQDLAKDSSEFLRFLYRDSCVRTHGKARAEEWLHARAILEEMTWATFRHRWKTMYQERTGLFRWLVAPLWMPWHCRYQRQLFRDALERIQLGVKTRMTNLPRERR